MLLIPCFDVHVIFRQQTSPALAVAWLWRRWDTLAGRDTTGYTDARATLEKVSTTSHSYLIGVLSVVEIL